MMVWETLWMYRSKVRPRYITTLYVVLCDIVSLWVMMSEITVMLFSLLLFITFWFPFSNGLILLKLSTKYTYPCHVMNILNKYRILKFDVMVRELCAVSCKVTIFSDRWRLFFYIIESWIFSNDKSVAFNLYNFKLEVKNPATFKFHLHTPDKGFLLFLIIGNVELKKIELWAIEL